MYRWYRFIILMQQEQDTSMEKNLWILRIQTYQRSFPPLYAEIKLEDQEMRSNTQTTSEVV